MQKNVSPHIIQSISELHRLFALPKPEHPMVSVINFELLSYKHSNVWSHFANDFYCITIKKGHNGKFKYGQSDYDFNEGKMTFTKPGQVFSVTATNDNPVSGYMLVFKADLIRRYPLGKSICNYGFFAYAVAEALHLSDKEDALISALLLQMQQELKDNPDDHSSDVVVSHIDLLLNYSNRFYNRQFLTRKTVSNDLLTKLEQILTDYFHTETAGHKALPTVAFIANELNLSPNYLSDLLRNTTGQNAQQYIQSHLVEKAKGLLATANCSISEVAYQLGFEYPQSFNKLFKKSTGQTPMFYRQSFK